ncbi:MAG: LPXTG cell wall anchor domain-containing protein [Vescimonas sp.]
MTSAKTGDAGIALYAGLSLLALSGSGWAVGKKRRGEK